MLNLCQVPFDTSIVHFVDVITIARTHPFLFDDLFFEFTLIFMAIIHHLFTLISIFVLETFKPLRYIV